MLNQSLQDMNFSNLLNNTSSYSCYHFHSNRMVSIVTFIKNKDIISIKIDTNFGNILRLSITEDKLKTIPKLHYCYIASLFLTEDTSKIYEVDDKQVIYKRQVWKNMYITTSYSPEYIDISDFTLVMSCDNYIDENMEIINSIVLISDNLFKKMIEEKMRNTEEVLFKCEINVDRLRALNKIIPENFPKDLYKIIQTQLVIV